jgi:SAM-dependent methyltransferase
MPSAPPDAKPKPSYGWDAPSIMLAFLVAGASLAAGGLLLWAIRPFNHAAAVATLMGLLGFAPLLLGLAMLQYGLVGKRRTRDAMLNLIAWRGDEAVLDIGTGAGLMIGAAQRLHAGGHVTGIDIWSAKDLSNNAAAATRRNITIMGVGDRTRVVTADATNLPFPDHSFDVVLLLLCLHNIEPKSRQVTACREIARVLKPGGTVVIGDYVPTHAYAEALWDAGLVVERSRSAFGVAGALMWLLVARKHGGAAELH